MSQAPRQLEPPFDGPRACRPYELASVVDLINLVFRTENVAPGRPPRRPTMGTEWGHVYEPGNLDNVRVVVERGQVVASLGIYAVRVRTPQGEVSVAQINCFATHPDYRHHGFGSALMRDAQRKMAADGHHLGLLSTKIQDYYRKLGWECAGEQRTFVFDRGNIGLLPEPSRLDVTEDWQPHAGAVVALREHLPFGVARPVDDFLPLAERTMPRLFVALRGGEVVAYAGLVGHAVQEYAGPHNEVAALLRAVFARIDDPAHSTSDRVPGQRATPEMTVVTPSRGDRLVDQLLRIGVPHRLDYLGMMIPLDPAALVRILGGGKVNVSKSGERWRLEHRGESLEVSERELLRQLFGPERSNNFAAEVFPAAFYVWPMDQA